MPARKAAAPGSTEPTTTGPATRAPRRRTAAPGPADTGEPEVARLDEVAAIEAEGPAIHEDGAWVQADAVEVHQGAVGRIDATEVEVSQGAVGGVRADRILVQMGAIGGVLGDEIEISQGGAGSILARQVRIEQSLVRTLIAQQVEIHRPSAVLVLVAQRVSGDIRPLLDWRGALAFGLAVGVVSGLLGRSRKRA